jgi:hypothetical protein
VPNGLPTVGVKLLPRPRNPVGGAPQSALQVSPSSAPLQHASGHCGVRMHDAVSTRTLEPVQLPALHTGVVQFRDHVPLLRSQPLPVHAPNSPHVSEPHTVPSAAMASSGHAGPLPGQTSCGLHESPEPARQTVPDPRNRSVGQATSAPSHASARSHPPATGLQIVPPPERRSAGQAVLEPVHVSAGSHAPADVRQEKPLGRRRSAGQAAPPVVQFSPTSHVPAAGRHGVEPSKNVLVGQSGELPLQFSTRSHGPAAARHTVDDGSKPLAVHVGTPLPQSIVPRSQARPVLQGRPAEQAMQLPPLQTWPEPHAVPSGSGASAGQSFELPLHDSTASQLPAALRQVTPAGRS